jgi:Flp pilus assembly pilin Flp
MRIVIFVLTAVRRQSGQTMAEYGILIAWVALLVIVAAITLGSHLASLFSSTAQKV